MLMGVIDGGNSPLLTVKFLDSTTSVKRAGRVSR